MSEPIGYKRPPVKSRWKKGQSGNPSGRKPGALNLRTDLVAELKEVIQINEGGSARRITKQRALLKSLAARGIQGDARAANLIFNLIIRLIEGDAAPQDESTPVSAQDEAVLAAYVKRVQAKGDKP